MTHHVVPGLMSEVHADHIAFSLLHIRFCVEVVLGEARCHANTSCIQGHLSPEAGGTLRDPGRQISCVRCLAFLGRQK